MLYLTHLISFSLLLCWSFSRSGENSIYDYVANKRYLLPTFGYMLGVIIVYGFKALFL